MRQTKREAITDCRKHWVEMKEIVTLEDCIPISTSQWEDCIHNLKIKAFYKLWPRRVRVKHYCFACEYNAKHKKWHCYEKCLLTWNSSDGDCTEELSEFYTAAIRLNEGDITGFKLACDDVIQLCDNALAKLPKRG